MRKRITAILASIFLVGAVLTINASARTLPGGAAQRERHPMIRKAIAALERAKDDLQDAAHDYCGHRAEALEATNNAINQLRLALESDRASLEPLGPAPAMGFIEKASFTEDDYSQRRERRERHPKIRQAINALERAKTDLQNAAHDFKGHREEALEATNRALNQLRAALACDRD